MEGCNQGCAHGIHEYHLTQSDTRHHIRATKISFENQGDFPVWIGLRLLLPGDYYKIDIEHPNYIDYSFSIRFEASAVSSSGSLRISEGRLLLVQLMNPKTR